MAVSYYRDADAEFDTSKLFREITRSDNKSVYKINYRQALKFSCAGGSAGHWKKRVTIKTGRTSETALSA